MHCRRILLDQIAVVIATDRRQAKRHQQVCRLAGLERAAEEIAEIDDLIDLLRTNISKHRLECQMVAVNVGDRCKTHL